VTRIDRPEQRNPLKSEPDSTTDNVTNRITCGVFGISSLRNYRVRQLLDAAYLDSALPNSVVAR
jgi:hypothetical protein